MFAMAARYDKPTLSRVIGGSWSYSDALRRLGIRSAGGNHATIKKYVALWGIPTDHFNKPVDDPLHRPRVPLSEILVEGSTYHRGHLQRRFFAEGIKNPRCELCGQGETWRGQPMALVLDHINGVANENRLQNLRIVCPNCSATIDTHCGRKNRAQPVSRNCIRCDAEFVPADPCQRYCSQYCGRRWDRSGRARPGTRHAVRKWVQQYEREHKADRART